MDRTEMQNEIYPDCPIRNILARICDKWSLLVLYVLSQEPLLRFNALQKRIPDISQKMLTVTLRTLEEDGYVKREVFAEVPPRVEYSLTARAVSLLPYVDSLITWAKDNMAGILEDRSPEAQMCMTSVPGKLFLHIMEIYVILSAENRARWEFLLVNRVSV